MYRKLLKRLIDLFVALCLLILLSPLILIITVVLLFTNEGRPFFYQDRPSYKERKIRIMKFQSMTDKKDAEGKLLPDNERIIAMGKFICLNSLGQLPQFLNVLKGEMSLIGPRHLLFKYLPLNSEE